MLERYAIERILYRISVSPHAERFVVKGAMLFAVWMDEPHRPTRDLDLLGTGDDAPAALESMFVEIIGIEVPDDGVLFDFRSLRVETINAEQAYEGVRITLRAELDGARIPVQIDVVFGADVRPSPELVDFPTLLDLPAPKIRAYPREVAIAEKYQAMVDLGIANSRMKDFHDIAHLARGCDFDGERMCEAIGATFRRRRTEVPVEAPLALTAEFFDDQAKRAQWRAFVNRSGISTGEGEDLATTVELLGAFLLPPSRAVALGEPFSKRWPSGGPWEDAP